LTQLYQITYLAITAYYDHLQDHCSGSLAIIGGVIYWQDFWSN